MGAAVCKFCGAKSKLVKSHIVPRSFYFLDHEMPHMVMPLDKVARAKRSPIGIWDEHILCDQCEDRFGFWDNYAYNHLIGRNKELFVCRDGEGNLLVENAFPVAVYSANADRRNLRDFAISVLWRAHASSREEMSGINLGENAEVYRRILSGEAVENEGLFALAMTKESNPDWRGLVSVIGECPIEGVGIHRFTAGGYTFLIRTSDSSEVSVIDLLFRPYAGSKQMMLCKSERSSKFAEQLSGIAKANREAHGDPWRGLRKAAN